MSAAPSSGTRAAAAIGVALLVTACGGARAPEPSATFHPDEPSEDRLGRKLPLSPMAFRSFAFDYGALPLLEPAPVDGLPDASFAISRTGPTQALIMTDGLEAEVRIGDLHLSRALQSGVPLERTSIQGAEAVCGRNVTTRATWQGFVRHGSSVDAITFACYEGVFDGRSCSVVARRAWRVEARRLAEGGVYGFRSIEGACGEAPEHTVGVGERLDVIGPRPVWVGSSDPHAVRPPSPTARFAHLTLPVSRGSSSSAVLDVSATDLLSSIRHAPVGVDDLSYSFEIVWPEAAPAPSATAFVSALRGDPSLVTPPPTSEFTFSDG